MKGIAFCFTLIIAEFTKESLQLPTFKSMCLQCFLWFYEREKHTVNFGSRILYTSTSSIIRSNKLENALSNTIPAMDGSSAP